MAKTVRLANGVRINYVESGDPGGEPLLLLQERLRDGIAGARLVVYEGVGHAFHWKEPERFARDLTAFIRRGA